jgi:PAS domain S-box-containing protein
MPAMRDLERRLAEAEATIQALLSGQIDAVVDARTMTPVLLSKAQGALHESEERYRRIVETASEGIVTIDLAANITFANRALSELVGRPLEEIIGRSALLLVPERHRARGAARFARVTEGAGDEAEVEYVRSDGSEGWALIKSRPIRDPNGALVGVLSMLTDRSERRDAEESLRESEALYRQIVEATTDGIIQMDIDRNFVFVNGRFAEMLGYQPAEMIGTNLFDYMSAAGRPSAAATMAKGDTTESLDRILLHRDGSQISVSINGTHLVDANGTHVGYQAVIRDVTERQKLQQQLMVSDRMASVGTLAAGVAHEINNPLAAVVVNLDYIADTVAQMSGGDGAYSQAWFRTEIAAPLDDAREAAQQVRFIVRDLKIFSRSPADEPRGAVDVKSILESSLRMAWNEIRHRARLVKHYGPVPDVQANEARLGQVFLNLIVNAAQAIPEGRAEHNQIRVVTRAEGDRVLIEVSDTGEGIPPETIGRVFDAFYTTKPVGVGTGLGLAICHRIVTDLGGTRTVESEVGTGTTFRVSLPTAVADAAEDDVPAAAVTTSRRGRILVVDDDRLVVNGIKRILGKLHEVVAIVAAKDALALLADGSTFDLILCDLMMPDMTGMDLYRELVRVAPDHADRMIFMTGGAFTAEARQFLTETPKEHLEKPFGPGNLRAIVQRYLR